MSSRRNSYSEASDFDLTSQSQSHINHSFFHTIEDESGWAVSGVNTMRSGVLSGNDIEALRALANDEEFNEAGDMSQFEHSAEDNDASSINELSGLRSVASRQTYSTFNDLYKPNSRMVGSLRLRNGGIPLGHEWGTESMAHPELLKQEVGLLRDNGIDVNLMRRTVSKQSSFTSRMIPSIYGAQTTALSTRDIESVVNLWDEAVDNGEITTSKTWTELKVLMCNSFPLIVTFLLQSLLGFNALFFIGKLNKFELLSAFTLGSMTGNITGLVIVQGLSTCLDTLCSQAYGAGKYHLVGTYFQRCTFLILLVFVPISLVWWLESEKIIVFLVSAEASATSANEMAHYASLYLKYLIPGIPGYILFETGKRFLQAQGIYTASTYTLVGVLFTNFGLNMWLIDEKRLGFLGAPVALSITFWLMPLGLLGYVLYVSRKANERFSQRLDLSQSEVVINADDPLKCWPGLKLSLMLKNWGLIFKLAIPGTIMCLAELLAFEILTFSSSHISAEALAAQSIIASVGGVSFQIPFGVSIAASTRVANLIGASLPKSLCYKTIKVSLFFGLCLAFLINFNVLYFGRHFIPSFFTSDQSLIDLTAENLPLIAYISIFDEITAISSGVLRGMGLPKIGSWLNLTIYYLYGVPASFILAFHYKWGIAGLWIGVGSGLSAIGIIQCLIIWYGVNYDQLVDEAKERNDQEV